MWFNILNLIYKILFGKRLNPFNSDYINYYIHKETGRRCTKIIHGLSLCSRVTDCILYKDKKYIKLVFYIDYYGRNVKTLYFPLLDEVVNVVDDIEFIVKDGVLTIYAFYKE